MRINIKNKLLIILLVANGLLALGMYALATKRIDSQFLNYLNQQQNQKLEPFINAIGQTYGEFGDWHWIKDRGELWRRLVDRYVMEARRPFNTSTQGQGGDMNPFPPPLGGPGMPPPRRDGTNPPPPPGLAQQGPLSMDMHFLVRDTSDELVIGSPAMAREARWLPIRYNDQTVGELGVITIAGATTTMNEVFVNEQKRILAFMVLGLLASAVIISLLIASYFRKPIARMTRGVHKLVAGDYQQTLQVDSEDEFGQLAGDFNLLSRTLWESQQSRRQWIADISHELRTPVAIMQGELHAMLDGVRPMDREAVVSLQQETQRLGNLIGDLHELSLSDLGALAYNKQPLDLGELLAQFIEDKEAQASDAGLSLYKHLPGKALLVFADDARLEQLFKNLFQNTLRYTDAPGKLMISLEATGNKAVIRWEDSAPGIGDEDIPKLFERLYRVDKSRSRAKGGSGLGMSICKNIVDAHDGEISLYHPSLGGLGVRITLPLAQS